MLAIRSGTLGKPPRPMFCVTRRGFDKGGVDQPLFGHVSSRRLDLLPSGAQGPSPQDRQALDSTCHVSYKMHRVLERLRTFLRDIGPGGVRGGLVILVGTLALLILSLAAVWFGLVALERKEAERDVGGAQYTISAGIHPEDFPLIFGPGPSPNLARSASDDDGRSRGIPGLSEMEVIGYLQHIPGTDFRCPGSLNKRVCTLSSTDGPAVYEVSFLKDGAAVFAVVATAYDASEDEAAGVLGYVARLSLKDASPVDAEAWVGRTISSGGQYFADGAEVRLYGAGQIRTLEIVATAPPNQILEFTDLHSPEITEQSTGRTPR